MVSRWLWPGNRTFFEVATMVVTWWIAVFWCSVGHCIKCDNAHSYISVYPILHLSVIFTPHLRIDGKAEDRWTSKKLLYFIIWLPWHRTQYLIPLCVIAAKTGNLKLYMCKKRMWESKSYNSDLFWNHTWKSAQWRALCTKITDVNLSVFVYRLFHEDLSPIIEQMLDLEFVPIEWNLHETVCKQIQIN